uniref:type I protein arginine methyltransferase n=1 Tax=Strigamia maritima TaxID=126957 RepID=T1JIP0_STRMM
TDTQAFKQRIDNLKANRKTSVFSERTDEASAMQYFQFYGYLSQQQNMMQDYIRTSTYQRAILANLPDFKDKVVLDVGAGSGILSFFAIQAGARKVYAIEASSMAQHAETLVYHNKCGGKIVVLPGKIEEVAVPEQVDVIISEPMGYMLFNERMLETYLHAKKWLTKSGKMYPCRGDLHIAPFTDDTLYMEQFSKANFWYQQAFHGVDLSSLRQAAMKEYFRQPIVDTFDIRICMAKSLRYTVDFLTAEERDLHCIEVPLEFQLVMSGTVHGLAFWFDVAFIGSIQTIWLSTSPTEPLTHWYQVRCLLETPIFVKEGQLLTGKVVLVANKRQSYDVEIELCVEGTGTRSFNTLDLKNPYFRYTGQVPQPPPGQNNSSPSENYWNQFDQQQLARQTVAVNGIAVNGIDEIALQQHSNLIGISPDDVLAFSQGNNTTNGINQNANVDHIGQQRAAQSRIAASMPTSSIGGGISPSIFTQVQSSRPTTHTATMSNSFMQQSVVMGNTSHYPVSNNFMIGDYVTPGNIILPTQGLQSPFRQ